MSGADFGPFWRNNATGETAREAALAVKPRVKTQRERVLDALADGPATPEVISARIEATGVRAMLMSVRPRCSELMRLGEIVDSGLRGPGAGGCKAIIWRLATPEEKATYLAAKAVEQ